MLKIFRVPIAALSILAVGASSAPTQAAAQHCCRWCCYRICQPCCGCHWCDPGPFSIIEQSLTQLLARHCVRGGRHAHVAVKVGNFVHHLDADLCPGELPRLVRGAAAPDGRSVDAIFTYKEVIRGCVLVTTVDVTWRVNSPCCCNGAFRALTELTD